MKIEKIFSNRDTLSHHLCRSRTSGEINLTLVFLGIIPLALLCIINLGLNGSGFHAIKTMWQASIGVSLTCFYLFLLKQNNLLRLFHHQKNQVRKGVLSYLLALPIMMSAAWIGLYFSEEVFMFAHPSTSQETTSYFLQTIRAFDTAWIAPVNEEIVFRGILQSYLNRWINPLSALILVSFIFAVAHLRLTDSSINLDVVFSCFISALFLGYLFHKTGSLIASITFHVCLNSTTVLLGMLVQ